MELSNQIDKLKKDFDQDIEQILGNSEIGHDSEESSDAQTPTIDDIYLKYFSKKNGLTTLLLKSLPTLTEEEKKQLGAKINELAEFQRQKIEEARATLAGRAQSKFIDLSIPVKGTPTGYLHPTTQVIRELYDFFRYYGFSFAEGPEIETAEYNFRKLNLPEGHPATDLQDTLFIQEPDILLRTHTSSVEARILTEYKPPLRVVVAGKCYRNETPNATNTPFFHQFQGVVVDKGITIQHLFFTIEQFHKKLFGEDTEVRFRYKYYPEVSPGVGADMKCKFCQGQGCDVCKHRGWIEVLGSGMIHYNTLKMCGIDPEEYTGYAFGVGLDRLVLQRFGINDIRLLYGGGMVYN